MRSMTNELRKFKALNKKIKRLSKAHCSDKVIRSEEYRTAKAYHYCSLLPERELEQTIKYVLGEASRMEYFIGYCGCSLEHVAIVALGYRKGIAYVEQKRHEDACKYVRKNVSYEPLYKYHMGKRCRADAFYNKEGEYVWMWGATSGQFRCENLSEALDIALGGDWKRVTTYEEVCKLHKYLEENGYE